MKKCNKCGQALPFDSFSRDKDKRDGHRTICRSCSKISSALSYQKNKEEISRKSKIHYQLNKEQISEKGKLYNQRPEVQQRRKIWWVQYYEKNKDKVRAQRKIYRDNNKESIVAKKKLYRQRPEVKERLAARQKSPEVKERRRQRAKERYYRQREKILAQRAEYMSRPEVIQAQKEYDEKHREAQKARNKKYSEDNKEILKQKRKEREQRPEFKERQKQWYKEYYHRPETQERIKEYQSRPEVKERDRIYKKEYRQRKYVQERIAKYYRNKRKNDVQYRLRNSISRCIRKVIIDNGGTKKSTTWSKLPYTPQQLKEHLEAQFESWMNWDNHGEWHIDHIYPQSKLPYDSMDHPNFLKSWALENLRPLKATENISKSDKIIEGKEDVE